MAEIWGFDSDSRRYESPSQFWSEVGTSKNEWYKGAVEYWDNQSNTDDGVLGGLACLSEKDVRDSLVFIKKIAKVNPRMKLAVDGNATEELCAFDGGAGVGRVTDKLLLNLFSRVDLVEPSQQLIDTAKERLCDTDGRHPGGNRADQFFCMGLQDFQPEHNKYDCAWIQWCLMYLTDADMVSFLVRCKESLKPGGVIMIKENIAGTAFVVDRSDNSISRTDKYMKALIRRAGLKLTADSTQKNWPKDLFTVKMYACAP